MEHSLIFHILGIQETSDEAAIKSAYLNLLKTTNPEDDPEGFKRLREAYEGAVTYARRPQQEEQKDKSEIDLWIDRVDRIYQDIRLRRQHELWKEVLSDPLCDDLDTSLQAREAMVVYLMDHIYLPQAVWQMLDNTFQLSEDREGLSQQFPENFLNYMFYYIENPQAISYDLFQVADEEHMAVDDYIRCYLDIRRQISWQQFEGCATKLNDLDAFGLHHPYADIERLRILTAILDTGKPDSTSAQDEEKKAKLKSEAAICIARVFPHKEFSLASQQTDLSVAADAARHLIDKLSPLFSETGGNMPAGECDDYIMLYCAYGLWALDQKEEAYELWQSILNRMPTHYMAKLGVSHYLVEKANYHEAKELMLQLLDKDGQDEEVLDLMRQVNNALIEEYRARIAQPDSYLEEGGNQDPKTIETRRKEDTIELGWCLFQNEQPEEAVALMENFQPDEVTRYSYENLFGRLLYRIDRYEEALPHLLQWLEMIRHTEDDGSAENSKRISREFQACHLLSGCYHELKNQEQALNYVDMAAAAAQNLRDKLAAMQYRAYLLFCYKEYTRCIDACDQVIQNDDEYYPAYVQRQEAAFELHKGQQVVDDYYRAIRIYAGHYKPYLLALRVFFYHDQFEDAKGVLERARENQVEFSPYMRLYEVKVLRNLAENPEDRKKPLAIANELMAEHSNPDTDIEDLSEIEYEIALLHWDNDHLEEALKHMEAAIGENPNRMQYRMIRGHIYLDHGEHKKALAEYTAAKEVYSDSPVLHYNSGLCQEALGMKVLAMECYEETLKYRQVHREACEKLANFYRDRYQDSNDPEDFRKAIGYMDRQIEAKPTCHDLVHRGLFYMYNMDIELAVRDFEEALKYGPDEWVIYNNLGCCYERTNEYEKAIGYFEQALEHLGDKKSLLPYSNLADCYEALGDYRKSIECYQKNLAIEPDNKNTFKELSFLYRYLGDYKNAVRYIEKDPDNDNYYARLGDIQFLEGQISKALSTYKKGVRTADKEDKADRYSDLASYYRDQLLDFKKAETYYLKALALETDEDELHELEWELAVICFRMKHFAEAKAHAQKSLQHFSLTKWKSEDIYLNYRPYRPARLFRHGWLYICLGETEKGLNYLNQMRECMRCKQCRHRECFESYLYLAIYYEAIEDYHTASEYYEKALKANPHSITAKATWEHLRKKMDKATPV